MSDSHLVDPQGWEYDLQSVYSAYIGYFQLHGVSWHDRTWGQFFETFEQFLAFSWPVITVTDARTGCAHIVTRMSSIISFLKMIKLRFGEILPQMDNVFLVVPFETAQRQLWHVSDGSTYNKLHAALPAATVAALKTRIRAGEPTAIRELWSRRDKTFLAIDFKCVEGNDDVRSCVEWGYAAVRCSHLMAAGAWPPVPDTNYRKGHYVISEYADKVSKSAASWQYAFGRSQVIPRAKLPRIIQSVLSSLASPDSDGLANVVVLVGHGVQVILQRLDEMKIQLPANMFMVDIAHLERTLYTSGERGEMHDRKTGHARAPGSLLTLGGLLRSFGVISPTAAPCVLGNAGNDAFMALVMFQRMVDPRGGVSVSGGGAGAVGVGGGVGNGYGNGHGRGKENGHEQGHRDVMARGNGHGNGNSNGKGEKEGTVSSSGHGHVKRAATVAARLFRPLGGGTRPESNAHAHADLVVVDPHPKTDGVHGRGGDLDRLRYGRRASGVVDEVGVVHGSMKRTSMASMLGGLRSSTLPAPTSADRPLSQGAIREKTKTVSATGAGRARTIAPDQRRLSTIEERRYGRGVDHS